MVSDVVVGDQSFSRVQHFIAKWLCAVPHLSVRMIHISMSNQVVT